MIAEDTKSGSAAPAPPIKALFKTHRLDRLTEFGVKQYRKHRKGEGASEASINREIATLSHMLRSAVKWKWIRPEAMPALERKPEPRKPIITLSEEQSDKLMRAAIADQDGRLWLFVAFGLNAAMRHREILSVRFEHIDFANHRIFIPQAKAGERDQPITNALAAALKRQRDMTVGYFRVSVATGRSMAKQFLRTVVRAGLDPDKVTPHTMRHTAITRLVEAGVDLPTIQRISGHKTLVMVLRYVHLRGKHIDAAIDKLDRASPGVVTQELHTPDVGLADDDARVVAISSGKSAV